MATARATGLSAGQRTLWFLYQLAPETASYNAKAVFRVAPVDLDVLARAVQALVDRHVALRCTFGTDGEQQPVQWIHETLAVPLEVVDVRGLAPAAVEARALALTDRPLDLAASPLRVNALVTGEREVILCVTVHHIVVDGGAVMLLLDELLALYAALRDGTPPPPAPTVQFDDYVRWEAAWLASPAATKARTFWAKRLGNGVPVLDLPTDKPRPPLQSLDGGTVAVHLDATLTAGLRRLAADERTTVTRVLLAAYTILLARLAGQRDLTVGLTSSNRRRAEFDRLIGYVVNPFVLRAAVAPGRPFRQFLAELSIHLHLAMEHADLPFPALLDELRVPRDPSRPALFQAYFGTVFGGTSTLPPYLGPPQRATAHGLTLETVYCPQQEGQFDLSLTFVEDADGIAGHLQYVTALFERATIERWAQGYATLLAAIVADPGAKVGRLPIMTAAERARVIGAWNATHVPEDERPLIVRFEGQARRRPDAIAARAGDVSWTYRELDRHANGVARHLHAAGLGPEDKVVVLASRGLPFLAAILGIYKVGAAYVPLDPAHPVERNQRLRVRIGAKEVLTDEVLAQLAPDDGEGLPHRPALPSHLAYVLHTSGSTGVPKGVLIEHRGLLNHLDALIADLAITDADVLAQTAPPCFDISVWQLLAPVVVGACTLIVPESVTRDPQALLTTFARERVTLAQLVPSMLRALLDEPQGDAAHLPHLRWMSATGEALPPELIPAWLARFPSVPLLNAYGPAECSDDVTLEVITAPTTRPNTPVGRPIRNHTVVLYDDALEPVATGVVGELCVGGIGVGRGYLDDPAKTADAFLPDPWGPPGARMYRSGDLARRLPDGRLEYLGRLGNQVKIRGNRIELGEIMAALAAIPGVRENVVIAREDVPGVKRLVGYVVGTASLDELRRALGDVLPEYMVPTAFVTLPALPLTDNGKVDLQRLPAPAAVTRAPAVAPSTPTEKALAAIWRELLNAPEVGVADNFFALGGDSLFAIQVVARAARVGLVLTVEQVYRHQTIAALAPLVDAAGAAPAPAAVVAAVEPREPFPLSYRQTTFWFLQQVSRRWAPFASILAVRAHAALDGARLHAAVDAVVARHPGLRTHLGQQRGKAFQTIDATGAVAWTEVDARGFDDAQLQATLREIAERPWDVTQGPVLRAFLLREADDRAVFVLATTLIHADGWSLMVMLQDTFTRYRDASAPFAPLPHTFADMVAREVAMLAGPEGARHLAYWKQRLDGAPHVLELPSDFPRPKTATGKAGKVWFTLDAPLCAALRAIGQDARVTTFAVYLAAFELALHATSKQDDLLLSTPATLRPPGFEDVVGAFLNTIVLRSTLRGDPTFVDFLRAANATVAEALEHCDYPYALLVEQLKAPREPGRLRLTQVMLNQQRSQVELDLGMPMDYVAIASSETQFDLELVLLEQETTMTPRFEYNAELFAPSRMERFSAGYQGLLERIAATPTAPVSRLLAGLFALVLFVLGACGPSTTTPPHPARPLIPRALLFEDPERDRVSISPDGAHLAWLAPSGGVKNLWVAPVAAPADAHPVTQAPRSIQQYEWATTGTHLLYQLDTTGEENFHLLAVDVATGAERDLSPAPEGHNILLGLSGRLPTKVLIAANDRDPEHDDAFLVDVVTGETTRTFQNDRYFQLAVDGALTVRIGQTYLPDGGVAYEDAATRRAIFTANAEDAGTTSVVAFDEGGKTAYLFDSRGRDTAALVGVDLATGALTVLAEDPRADAEFLLRHPRTGAPQALTFDFDRRERRVLAPDLVPDFTALTAALGDEYFVTSRTLDDTVWTVATVPNDAAARFVLWDRKARRVTPLFSSRPKLDGHTLARTRAFVIPARDGLPLVSYLTLPPGTDRDADGLPDAPLPTVLLIHGGPWARADGQYEAEVQLLASRGYAVLKPNYRGSTGFGKKFLNAGNHEFGAKMQDDLLDATAWVIARGVAPRDKICIAGESYGGYAALLGLAATPTTFACGVDLSGDSNLVTSIEAIPPYWKPILALIRLRVGDWESPAGRAKLLAQSPISKVDQIVRPLLVGHGANDPRVKQAESDRVVAALTKRQVPVTYAVFLDEGHQFLRPDNSLAMWALIEAFLARHLGGAVEPFDRALFERSSMKIMTGAELIPGLADVYRK